mmetsp:Transcript_19627/g.66230  ORF Transcript_19627/g.66230 Transcript_19627/m.66230 type:complete len:371 (+) Transcript_19627:2204-3316(+)
MASWPAARRMGGGAAAAAELEESLEMNSSMAFGFLLVASGMLLSLYLLLQAGFTVVLLLIVALFTLASSHALASLLAPASAALLPARLKTATVSLGPCGEAELATLLVWPLCLALAGTWFLCRRTTWAWALQDVLGAAVCATFVRTVQLPSLEVGVQLLGLMFLYDIFMVFLSPLFFHKSVMMSVATAGQPSATVRADGTCERYDGERMPMLLMIPRGDPSRGDYAMLGLGDIVVPGLLLTFAARCDLSLRGAASPFGYWGAASAGYLAGLACALAANMYHLTINGVQGQPALLYLVPLTTGPVSLLAHLRGELPRLWSGEALLPATQRSLRPVGAAGGAADEALVSQQLCGFAAAPAPLEGSSHYKPLP